MIFDRTVAFCTTQSVLVSGPSSDVFDLGPMGAFARDLGKGQQIPLLIQVVEDFNNLTSFRVTVQTDDDTSFASPRNVVEAAFAAASMKNGKALPIIQIPPGVRERFMRLYFTITGTAPTTGKITAGMAPGVETVGARFG